MSLTRYCDTMVLTASSATLSPLSWEKLSWPFFRLLLCLFLVKVHWLPRVVFLLCHWTSLAAVHPVQPPAWSSREPSDLCGLKPDGPSWASIVLSTFGCLSRGAAPCLTVLRTIWSEWTWFGQSPLALCSFPLGSHFRTVQEYCTWGIFSISYLDSIWFFFSCSFKYSVQLLYLLTVFPIQDNIAK